MSFSSFYLFDAQSRNISISLHCDFVQLKRSQREAEVFKSCSAAAAAQVVRELICEHLISSAPTWDERDN